MCGIENDVAMKLIFKKLKEKNVVILLDIYRR